MNFIEDLYYGRIEPCARGFYENTEYRDAVRGLDKSRQRLTDALSEENIKLFNEFLDRIGKFETISEFESFRMGFCMGVKMMHDSLR